MALPGCSSVASRLVCPLSTIVITSEVAYSRQDLSHLSELKTINFAGIWDSCTVWSSISLLWFWILIICRRERFATTSTVRI